MKEGLPEIYLARHGETPWSVTGRHTGRTDLALTAAGEIQARRLGERLAGLRFGEVLSSPLQRARLTCELAGFGGRMSVEPLLREWDYGDYEGLRTEEIRRERPDWSLFGPGCPGGESAAEVASRADRVVARLRKLGGDALLFGHRHFFCVLAARWAGLDAAAGRLFLLDEASLSVLGYHHTLAEPAIRLWNSGGAGDAEKASPPRRG